MIAIILGIVTGVVLGITGAGGGILAVPALVVGLGFAIKTATPIALIAVGMAALVGAIDGLRKHQVRYKAAFFMAAAGALCGSVGLKLGQLLPQQLLASIFAGLMLLLALRMFRQSRNGSDTAPRPAGVLCTMDPDTGRLRWTPKCATTLAAVGAATGIFAGMLGVGGGFIIVPALRRFTDIKMSSIVATSLMLVALVSLSAAASSVLRGAEVPAEGWIFAGAAIAGMLMGRGVAARIPERMMQRAFAGVTVVVACILLLKAWV